MNSALLMKPWQVDLPGVVKELHAHRGRVARMVNARIAIEHLSELLNTLHMLKLYERYFPAQYKKSKASTVFPNRDCYSPKELEFMRLVGWRLFPIAEFWDDEAVERWPCIPLETMGMWGGAIAEWPPFWRILLTLVAPNDLAAHMNELDWNELATLLPPDADLPLCVTHTGPVDIAYERFFIEATAWSPKLAQLPLAFRYIQQDTGNQFLDIDEEMLGYSQLPEWDEENIDWLTEEWKRARVLLDQMAVVRNWLEAKPERLARLIQIWNRHATVKPRARPTQPAPTHENNNEAGDIEAAANNPVAPCSVAALVPQSPQGNEDDDDNEDNE